jgi:hypothetical protein
MTFDGPPEVRGVTSGLMNRDVAQRVLVVYPRIPKAEARSVPVALGCLIWKIWIAVFPEIVLVCFTAAQK